MRIVSVLSHLALAAILAGPAGAGETLSTDHGTPVGSNQESKVAGPNGGVLLEDFHLIQKLARFDRERIPERVVHARGVGAYGEFKSAGDFSELTKLSLLGKKGKRTPVFVRMSTVIHSKGSPETLRDPRGFAVKFYTDEGNWDLVGNDLPVFFIRDAIKFPDMVHSLKPDPVTNAQDPNRFFDFFSHVPESTHMLTFLYSDLGIPANFRQMDGFGVHAFKLVNEKGEVRFAKFNWRSKQGVVSLTGDAVAETAARDHQHATKDLYAAIKAGDYPAWQLTAQILQPEQVAGLPFDAFDATKVWPEEVAPTVVLGTFELNRVPENFFLHTEQAAFSPGVQPPGIEPSPDRLLQGRLFSYADTQRYRLGANYLDIPVNRPRNTVKNNNQDGSLAGASDGGSVNYEPSITNEAIEATDHLYSAASLSGATQQVRIAKEMNFAQAGELYQSMSSEVQGRLIDSFVGDLGQVKSLLVRQRIVGFLLLADSDYGARVAAKVGVEIDDAREAAAQVEAERNKSRQISAR